MPTPPSGRRVRTRITGLAAAAALALAGCSADVQAAGKSSSGPATDSGTQAVVVRVIDGDTFEATVSGDDKTIRLLNVDTPETKDPNSPVECLGPEATKILEQLLPVGSRVRLELDVEPLDKYGRTLAGVFDSNGKLVNAEVARLGFGVPVLIEPNRKFHPPVAEAFQEARTRGAGLSSTDIPCLPAQQVEQAAQAVESLVTAPLAESASALDQGNAALVAALAAVAALKAAADAKNHVPWAAYEPARLAEHRKRLDAAAAAGSARQAAIDAKKKDLADAAAAEASRLAAESARQAAEAAAAAAAAAEAERVRNLPPVPAPYLPPAYVPPPYVPPAATNPYPGYTGPRCYAPGGKSWRPC